MTKKLKFLATAISVALSGGLFVHAAGIALADDLYNKIDGTIDASLETVNLVKGGADATVSYSVAARNGDGVDGCNLSASSTLTVQVESSNPAVATVTPASLTFANCTDVKTIGVKPVGAGQAEITLAQTANASAGYFNLSGAAFLAVVADVTPPDTTPPVITYHLSPEPNANGWNNADVTLTWSVSDPESTVTTKTGCDTVVQSTETSGATFTCSATSAGGVSTKTVIVKLDKTAPTVVITTPKNGAEYGMKQDVRADWSTADNGSGIATAVGTKASGEMIDTTTAGSHTFSVTATDKTGNSTTVTTKYAVEKNDDSDNGDHENNDDHDTVSVCHKGHVSISVGAPGARAHVEHGDDTGNCDDNNNDD